MKGLSPLFSGQISKTIARHLASTELAIILFGVICLAAIPGTLTKSRAIYYHPLFVLLLGMLAANLLFCTVRRWRSLARSTLLFHGGVLLTICGCVITSFGYVATVNVHEGASVDQVFRWDRNQDMPLGMDLAVKRIIREFYPVPVRVGVMRGEQKIPKPFTLRTGESFDLDGYRIVASSFDPEKVNLKLAVHRDGREIGTADTSGTGNLPAGFPYAFKLVSYQDPMLKRTAVDLQLTRGGKQLAAGSAEVNGPFIWNGLYFYHTLTDRDEDGRPYAGIQIVRDPGRPCVFSGFAVMSLGAVLAFVRRFKTGSDKGGS